MGKRAMRKKMNQVADELVKLNSDTEIIVRLTNTVSLRIAGMYSLLFTAERIGVSSKIAVDENAGVYYGPDGDSEEESWENHCIRRVDVALARLARREYGFECYPPRPA